MVFAAFHCVSKSHFHIGIIRIKLMFGLTIITPNSSFDLSIIILNQIFTLIHVRVISDYVIILKKSKPETITGTTIPA